MTVSYSEYSILQWNMGDSASAKKIRPNHLKRALILSDMLALYNPSVVTLQEANRSVLASANLNGYRTLYGPSGIVTLIKDDEFIVVNDIILDKRVHGVVLKDVTTRRPLFKIMNVHFPILFLNIEERREHIRKFVRKAEAWRAKFDPCLEIISGDFNLPPYDEVMMIDSGLYANRDMKFVESVRLKNIDKSIYNTSWKVFGEGCGSLGTYYHNSKPHGPWHVPDQVLLDSRIAINDLINVKILTMVNRNSLTKKNSNVPCKTNGSDHFPVLVTARMPSAQIMSLV